MGLDVLGLAPRGEKGRTIYGNHGWWREIADYCRLVAPDVCSACKYWYSNDGDGLDDAGAVALAEILRARISDHNVDDCARALAAKDKGAAKCGEIAELDDFVYSEASRVQFSQKDRRLCRLP